MSINGVIALPPAPSVIPAPSAMPPFSVSDIRKRTHAIQEVMKGVMKEGTHFGTIPGTPKPSLWKAGAEVLCMTFRLAPILESRVTVDDQEGEWTYTGSRRDGTIVTGACVGFFEVEATCTIQGPQGEVLSRCSARCNNREAKYRSLSLFEIRNTVLKIAEKRAFVSAVLMATGASDIFTQDIEDFPELIGVPVVVAGPASKDGAVVDAEMPLSIPSAPIQAQTDASPSAGSGLSPKRSAWLMRVGVEAKVSQDAMDRCKAYLQNASGAEVKTFFDELARRKGEVFRQFIAAS